MKINSQKTCEYCEPYKVSPTHITERILNILIFYEIQKSFYFVDIFLQNKFPKFYFPIKIFILENAFNLLIYTRILQEVDANNCDKDFNNRSAVILEAAKLRHLKINSLRFFGKLKTNFFSTYINKERIIFEELPPLKLDYFPKINFDDKFLLKQILKDQNLPLTEGQSFSSKKNAIMYAKRLGFPLVVKPREGSLSKHTICNIQDEKTLLSAIKIVKIISREFILEKYLQGNIYRITIVNNKVVACCLREPPNIIGDGTHTIEELINIKNDNSMRGNMGEKGFTLYKISINKQTLLSLTNLGLTPKSVLQKNRKIYLYDKVVLSCGADIHDKTDDIHLDNNFIFEKLARSLQSPIIGIDFICQDISKSYHKQKCAIIEVNSLPYIDMHHFPVSGKPRDVAGCLVDYFLLEKIN